MQGPRGRKEPGTLADQTEVLVAGKQSARKTMHRLGLRAEPWARLSTAFLEALLSTLDFILRHMGSH